MMYSRGGGYAHVFQPGRINSKGIPIILMRNHHGEIQLVILPDAIWGELIMGRINRGGRPVVKIT